MRFHFVIQDSRNIKIATNRVKKTLDAKYDKASLNKKTMKFKYLNSNI